MRFLDGLKTFLGLVGLALVALAEADVVAVLPPTWRPYVIGGSATLTALGLVHKGEKRYYRRWAHEKYPPNR